LRLTQEGAGMLRKARISDVKTIHRMINLSAGKGEMLSRSLMDMYNSVRDFIVYYDEDEQRIVGICAMNIIWENLAEIRSLYVDETCRKKGIGRKMVEFCISEAITLDLFRIFSLTYKKEFFVKLGFREVDRSTLPEKIWADCFRCAKYPDYCDEIAMIIEL
jgi:amino-acid N-acetyltransferase